MKKELEKLVNSKRSVIISGNTLSDKTQGVMFPIVDEIIKRDESLFIIDAKKEYYNKYFKELKKNNYNVVVISLNDPRFGDGWNPYNYIKELYDDGLTDYALAELENLHSRIFYNYYSSDPFWENSAADVASGAALSLIKNENVEKINFNSVCNIINSCATKYGVSTVGIEYFKNIKDKDVSAYSKVVVNAPKETRGGILSVASQRMRLFASREYLSKLLSKSTFSYKDLNKKTAIFVEVHKQVSYVSTLAVMLLEQILNYLEYNNDVIKLNFIMDNYDVLNHDKNLYNLLSYNDYKKAKLYVVTKSINRIKDITHEYYDNLATIVKVKESTIEINYSDDELIIVEKEVLEDKEYKDIEIKKLDIDTVEVFEIKLDIKSNDEQINVTDLIARIDKKLEELDKED